MDQDSSMGSGRGKSTTLKIKTTGSRWEGPNEQFHRIESSNGKRPTITNTMRSSLFEVNLTSK